LILIFIKDVVPIYTDTASSQFHARLAAPNRYDRIQAYHELLNSTNSIIGLYPSEAAVELQNWLLQAGFNSTYLKPFDNENAMLDYINQDNYGSEINPLAGAIEVLNLEGPEYTYALRFNSSEYSRYKTTVTTSEPSYSFFKGRYDWYWTILYTKGFQLFQTLIDHFVLEREKVINWPTGVSPWIKNMTSIEIMVPFPTSTWVIDEFTTFLGPTLGFLLTLMYLFPLTRVITGFVEEKELKLKASMQLMGLKSSALFLSWFTTYIVIFSIISGIVCLTSFWGLYANSNMGYIFLLYFLFGLTVFSVGFLLSAFFDTTKTASTFGSIIFVITFFISFASDSEKGTLASRNKNMAICLIPTACLTQTARVIGRLESAGVGLNWDTVTDILGDFSAWMGFLMLFIDFLLYLFLGLYFHQVTKTQFGRSKKWNFFLMPSYWRGLCSCCGKTQEEELGGIGGGSGLYNGDEKNDDKIELKNGNSNSQNNDNSKNNNSQSDPNASISINPSLSFHYNPTVPPLDPSMNEPNTRIQPPAPDDLPIVQVRNLRKTFPSSEWNFCSSFSCFSCFSCSKKKKSQKKSTKNFVALQGLSIDIYKGQIYSLLGENGAGKSTLFNMLTGLYEPSSGECFINGLSINDSFEKIYQIQGVCFQHDVLYPNLTVYEHMRLFAAVKNMDMSSDDKDKHIFELLDLVGLGKKKDNKLNSLSRTLSGGQKRKLSVAIALLNDPPVCILDEPSSGVDVHSSKAIQKILLKIRKNRVIIMTTHSMEEASILADRIGILAGGKLLCSGSSLFLKQQYEIGYTLTLKKNIVGDINDRDDMIAIQDPLDDYGSISVARFDSVVSKSIFVKTYSGKNIRNWIKKACPSASLAMDTTSEIAFKIPMTHTEFIPELLDFLEKKKENLGILTWSIGLTTLTEVFLRAIGGLSREELYLKNGDDKYGGKLYSESVKSEKNQRNFSRDVKMGKKT
jgi:ATP-binding cassette subfamily A (ABC1) protein 3